MSTEELWASITSKPKWYAGLRSESGAFISPQYANRLKHRFESGSISRKTILCIFKQYGYLPAATEWVSEN